MEVTFAFEDSTGLQLAGATRDNTPAAGFAIEGELVTQTDQLYRAESSTLRDRGNQTHTIVFSSTKRAATRALAEKAAVEHSQVCGRGTVTLRLADGSVKTATGAILFPPKIQLLGVSWTATYTIKSPKFN